MCQVYNSCQEVHLQGSLLGTDLSVCENFTAKLKCYSMFHRLSDDIVISMKLHLTQICFI